MKFRILRAIIESQIVKGKNSFAGIMYFNTSLKKCQFKLSNHTAPILAL